MFRRSFTLIEIVLFIVLGACALFGSIYFRLHVDGQYSWIIGGLLGFLLIPAIGYLVWLIVALVHDGIPRLPACRNGCCRGSDYELKSFGEGFAWTCKCGDHYTRRGRELHFLPDTGESIPVRKWRPLRGWFPPA